MWPCPLYQEAASITLWLSAKSGLKKACGFWTIPSPRLSRAGPLNLPRLPPSAAPPAQVVFLFAPAIPRPRVRRTVQHKTMAPPTQRILRVLIQPAPVMLTTAPVAVAVVGVLVGVLVGT